jgi:tetratricopeptide (TPR) repeat protein
VRQSEVVRQFDRPSPTPAEKTSATNHETHVRLIRARRQTAWALGLLTLLRMLVGARSAQAQDHAPVTLTPEETARARQLFETGVTQYEAGRYIDALQQFQEAYRIKPHPLVRVNIANCYDKLDRPVEAIENFEAFLAVPAGDPAQRDEVRAALKELQKRVGQVAFKVTPDGARVVIDDRDEHRAPISEPVRLSVGRHRVTVSLEGYETALRAVDVKPQETETLHVTLASLTAAEALPLAAAAAAAPGTPATEGPAPGAQTSPPPAPLPAPETTNPAPRRAGLPNSVWLAGGITIALAVTAIITGQLALAANREFDGNLDAVHNPQLNEFQRAGAWQRGVDAANRANGLAATTDVLLGCALAGAGLTTYFLLSRPDQPTRDTSAKLSAAIGPTGGRLQLQSHF